MITAPTFAAKKDQMICCSQRSLIGLPFTGMCFGGTRGRVAAVIASPSTWRRSLNQRPDYPNRDNLNLATRGIAGGGTLLRQVIKLGLLDKLELHIVPVILGEGMRLLSPELGRDGREGIELTPARVTATPDVTHIRYKINGRRPLVLDNRARAEEPAIA